MNPVSDSTSSIVTKYQSFWPHTCRTVRQYVDNVVTKGLSQEQVARFKEIYGKDCFKTKKDGRG